MDKVTKLYLSSGDLAAWRKRDLYTNNIYRNYASGPPIRGGHMVVPLRRRMKRSQHPNNEDYSGRYSFNFTDASPPIYNQKDWMAPLHPGMFFWTNRDVPEPFLAGTHYEDTGAATPDGTLHKYVLPFCATMPVRDQSGFVIGGYSGYTCMAYFSMGVVHFADATIETTDPVTGLKTQEKVFLPEDYRDPPNPVTGKRRKIDHSCQLFSLDTHWFMVGTGGIGSPKLGSKRWWFYSDPNSSPGICSEYIYALHGDLNSNWEFPVEFNIVGGSTEAVTFNISSARAYITP
jgi:hypothetical protein